MESDEDVMLPQEDDTRECAQENQPASFIRTEEPVRERDEDTMFTRGDETREHEQENPPVIRHSWRSRKERRVCDICDC